VSINAKNCGKPSKIPFTYCFKKEIIWGKSEMEKEQHVQIPAKSWWFSLIWPTFENFIVSHGQHANFLPD
jgi:hypothetical protein